MVDQVYFVNYVSQARVERRLRQVRARCARSVHDLRHTNVPGCGSRESVIAACATNVEVTQASWIRVGAYVRACVDACMSVCVRWCVCLCMHMYEYMSVSMYVEVYA